MLDAADKYQAGSEEWALRLANELNYTVRSGLVFGIKPLIPIVEQAIDHSPWKVWPEGNPAGSIDRFFLLATGRDYEHIYSLITVCGCDDHLARKLAAAREVDPLDELRQAWTDASAEERATFRREATDL
jgi:hypothetical protein